MDKCLDNEHQAVIYAPVEVAASVKKTKSGYNRGIFLL